MRYTVIASALLLSTAAALPRGQSRASVEPPASVYAGLKWRSVGPFRAGRVNGVTGVPETYLVGADGRIEAKHAEPLTEADAQALLARAAS